MSQLTQADALNRLLKLLPADDFALLSPELEAIALPRNFMMAEAGKVISHCYFVEYGIGSIVATSREGQKAEVGSFGREGLAPTALLMDVDCNTHDLFMQIAGSGHRRRSSSRRSECRSTVLHSVPPRAPN